MQLVVAVYNHWTGLDYHVINDVLLTVHADQTLAIRIHPCIFRWAEIGECMHVKYM